MGVVAEVRKGPPLPLAAAPVGSAPVGRGVDLVEGDEGGAVFLWGMAAWCWGHGDVVGRRLAAVQAVVTGAARHGEVASAFGVGEVTLWRWRRAYGVGGVEALAPGRPGPRRPSKLTEDKVAEIARLRGEGRTMDDIAVVVGVSLNSVSRALAGSGGGRATPALAERGDEADGGAPAPLEPLARPEPRTEERLAARRGELAGAVPMICEGASLPLVGALVVLPALVATGLLEAAASVYGTTRAAFYGLRSLVLAVVFAALVGEPRAEGLTRIDPVDLGRLLGLDRAPEPKTLRRRMAALARAGRSSSLLEALARHHLATHAEAAGVLYVDGHVRAYHGRAELGKAHVARMRISMPAELDTWLADARGEGVLVWSAAPGASLVGELRKVTASVRALVGPEARPTIAFDRGGWSPALFAELVGAGFHVLTYRKGPVEPEAGDAFADHHFTDEAGRRHEYRLADRQVALPWSAGRRSLALRQITRLDPETGHQTTFVTSRNDLAPAEVAHAMFSRWRQENFFRYLRAHLGLDALDSYERVADDPARTVPNPAKKPAANALAAARTELVEAEADFGRAVVEGARTRTRAMAVSNRFNDAEAALRQAEQSAEGIPARVPLGSVVPGAERLDPERKRIHDAVRMATYNAESALVRLLAPHFARVEDEARTLLREVYRSPGDLEIVGDQLHVRLNPLSAPRRSRALAGLCAELTATETRYPGTDLVLVYSVKGF